jgi:hypothetical protein
MISAISESGTALRGADTTAQPSGPKAARIVAIPGEAGTLADAIAADARAIQTTFRGPTTAIAAARAQAAITRLQSALPELRRAARIMEAEAAGRLRLVRP